MSVQIATGSLAQAAEVMAQIEELAVIDHDKRTLVADLQARIGQHVSLCLIAHHQGQPVGFKLGYELGEGVFYSWLGGVVAAHRQQGIAKALLMAQEAWVRQQGYSYLKVKTRNRYRAMLSMLIAQGYQIEQVEQKEGLIEYRIGFVKDLGEEKCVISLAVR